MNELAVENAFNPVSNPAGLTIAPAVNTDPAAEFEEYFPADESSRFLRITEVESGFDTTWKYPIRVPSETNRIWLIAIHELFPTVTVTFASSAGIVNDAAVVNALIPAGPGTATLVGSSQGSQHVFELGSNALILSA